MEQIVGYGFGPYRLETGTQLLHLQKQPIRLQPKVYGLLLYFLQHPGRLITREELLQQVWCGRIVEDTALRLAVNTLRQVLNDDSKMPVYILTVCRRGYRFLPEVRVEAGCDVDPCAKNYEEPLPSPDSKTPKLSQLLEAFTRASAGIRTLVFLDGERQTGKTALIEQFVDIIGQSGPAVLRARCVQLGGAIEPYLPLLEALERRCLKPGSALLIDCLNRIAPSWLYQLSNLLDPDELAGLIPRVAQTNAGRMLREGAQFFESLGGESTFVLILDNSHWSDEFTLDLINLLASRCSPAKLLMILSFRPDGNCPGVRRLETMRDELRQRGVCQELSLEQREIHVADLLAV